MSTLDKSDPIFDRLFDLVANEDDETKVIEGLRKESADKIEQFIGWFGWKYYEERRVLFQQELRKRRVDEAERLAKENQKPTAGKIWEEFLVQLPAQSAKGIYILLGAALALAGNWLWNYLGGG